MCGGSPPQDQPRQEVLDVDAPLRASRAKFVADVRAFMQITQLSFVEASSFLEAAKRRDLSLDAAVVEYFESDAVSSAAREELPAAHVDPPSLRSEAAAVVGFEEVSTPARVASSTARAAIEQSRVTGHSDSVYPQNRWRRNRRNTRPGALATNAIYSTNHSSSACRGGTHRTVYYQ